jgi:hypothetical protein
MHIVGTGGVGKSAILKSLALQQQLEGTVVALAPSRIVGGGWIQFASTIGCPVGRNELFNEIACGGAATLFVDNIDQIEAPDDWATLRDLLRGVVTCPGWRAAFTVRSQTQEWRRHLPDDFRQIAFKSIYVGEITDIEADVLRDGNPRLAALLSDAHPARALARNLFHLSRLIDLVPLQDPGTPALVDELDLAHAWWRLGGARSEQGKWERLKLLRTLGESVVRQPGVMAFNADVLDSATTAELLRAETLREVRAGATITFLHDTLRDWTIGFLLDEQPDLWTSLPIARAIPETLARGLEIAARAALRSDPTQRRWVELLARFEGADCHGSWRRPMLLALTRSENAVLALASVEANLTANDGQRFREILRLMVAVESVPLADFAKNLQLPTTADATADPTMVLPKGPGWAPLVVWTLAAIDRLPTAVIPDVVKLFQLWLMVTQGSALDINTQIVQRLFDWLTRMDRSESPRPVRHDRDPGLRFDNWREVHEQIRMTFLAFCHLQPVLAAQYLQMADTGKYRGAREILRYPGSAPKAAPAALADFALASLIPKERDGSHSHSRRDPFDLIDPDFFPASPGQSPFLALLHSAPPEGLRLVRGVVEHATDWHRRDFRAGRVPFPTMSIPFPTGEKSFSGPFGIYQWTRGGTGALVVASALMALEAWAHRQVEAGRRFEEVIHDVLGPSGSSVAFVCVAVDLALSHRDSASEVAWPLVATPELLHFDQMRYTQDVSGLGRFQTSERESAYWPVKVADLMARPSRHRQLIDIIGHLALEGPADIHDNLRKALSKAWDRIAPLNFPDDNDRINGLRATAARALRMTDATHWAPAQLQLADGTTVSGFQYQMTSEETALLSAARATASANQADLSVRLTIQKALSSPATSTPELVAQGIAWARAQNNADPTLADEEGSDDKFEREWKARARVMAAALAARDYDGSDRADVEVWCRSVLDEAAAEKVDDVAARTAQHVYSNLNAIAVLGYLGLLRQRLDPEIRGVLLALAAHQDHAVLNAFCSHLTELEQLDDRLSRSLTRIVFASASHPRHAFDAQTDTESQSRYRQRCAAAIDAEIQWLDGLCAEPPWPVLAPWHSRRRRSLRIDFGGRIGEEVDESQESAEEYVDEQALSNWIGCLVPLTMREPAWIVSLAENYLGWTIKANNGPGGDDDGARDNRPNFWNGSYFDLLGILCVILPFERGRTAFVVPMMRLHEEAFHDVVATFLRGFDRATFAADIGQPDEPGPMRMLLADRLRRGRMVERLNYQMSFTAETHLADALTAFFYQPSRWTNSALPHVPARWNGLGETISTLTSLVVSAPNSGYLAVVFLRLVESYPGALLMPYVIQAAVAWCKQHPAGSAFWTEHQIGYRVCAWIDRALTEDSEAAKVLNGLRYEVENCLDILVRSAIPSARALEARLGNLP